MGIGWCRLTTVESAVVCVCCGYRTLSEPPGSHEICAVCGWEDDVYQLRWPYRPGGANKSSLIDAQRRFASTTAEGEAGRADVADFDREPFWRPVDAERDRFEPRGGHLARWPEDRTVLYWWRRRTGTAWWEEVAPVVLDFAAHGGVADNEFIAAVRAVAGTAPPADPDNLSGMEIDFEHYLWRCPSVRTVVVSSSPDPARQLTARCLAEHAASPLRVAEEITQAWQRDLRYSYWEAHSVRITPTSVELHAATQIDEGGYFITAAIIVGWTESADVSPGRAQPQVMCPDRPEIGATSAR